MTSDLANKKQNVDIVITDEPLTPLAFWFPILAIVLLSGLGTFLVIGGNIYGISLYLVALIIWSQLK